MKNALQREGCRRPLLVCRESSLETQAAGMDIAAKRGIGIDEWALGKRLLHPFLRRRQEQQKKTEK